MAKPLALTSGGLCGIGPDIAIAGGGCERGQELDLAPFCLLGDRAFFTGVPTSWD